MKKMIRKIDIIPKTQKEFISISHGRNRFIDSYRFSSSKLDSLAKALENDDFEILDEQFPVKREYIKKKLADPNECFNSNDDYQKSVSNLKKSFLHCFDK